PTPAAECRGPRHATGFPAGRREAPPARLAPPSRAGDAAHKTFQSRNVSLVRSRFPRPETIPPPGISVEMCAKPAWNKAFPVFRIFPRTPPQPAPCAHAEPPVDLVAHSSRFTLPG